MRILARSHAQNLLATADVLATDRRPDHRNAAIIDGLRAQATTLEELACQARAFRSLDPDDPRPIQQMHLIRDRWRQVGHITEPERTAAARSLPPALAVPTALRDIVERHIDNGHWYHHPRGHRHPWQRTNAATQPPILDTARQTADHANQLTRHLPRLPSTPANQSPRDVLTPQLLGHDLDRVTTSTVERAVAPDTLPTISR